MNRVLVFGDIHGMLHKLQALITKVKPTTADKLIFLGDYIDRGSNAKGVIDSILSMREVGWDVVTLLGNHEEMLLDYLENPADSVVFMHNGGYETLESYGFPSKRIPKEHLGFLYDLRLSYFWEDYFFCHAGAVPGVALESQERDDLLWIRRAFIDSDYDWGKKVVYGHTTISNCPNVQKNKIGIDTGACFGGKLTCLILPGESIVQV